MPIDDQGLLEAVAAGAAEANAPAPSSEPETPEDETPEGELPAGEAPEGEAPEGETPEGEAPKDEALEGEAPEGEAPEGEAAAAKPAEGKPAEAKPAAKEPDPINDPLPPAGAVKEETRQRIVKLIDVAKTLTQKNEQVQGDFDMLFGAVQRTGASPEQYTGALQYLSLVNSSSPADREKALDMMLHEVRALSNMLGKPLPSFDPLEGHDDLRSAVQTGQITAQHAQELAASRNQREIQSATDRQQREVTQQRQTSEQLVQRGIAELNAVEAQLRADPQFAAKRAALVPLLKPVMAQLPPERWAATFQEAYRNMQLPAAPAPAAAPAAAVPAQQPLRGKSPGGASARAPKDMAEAIRFGLTQAAR